MPNIQEILETLSTNKTRFIPIKGSQEEIDLIERRNGSLYFATDTKRILLDTYVYNKNTQRNELTRLIMGSGVSSDDSNFGFVYANATFANTYLSHPNPETEPDIYLIDKAAFGEDFIGLPLQNTLIVNSNGWFFKVIDLHEQQLEVVAQLISSGGGGGSSEGSKERGLSIVIDDWDSLNLVNGQTANLTCKVLSARNYYGEDISKRLIINWKLEQKTTSGNYVQYAAGFDDSNVVSDELYVFEYGTKARFNTTSRLTLTLSQPGVKDPKEVSFEFITSELKLELPSNFSNTATIKQNDITFTVNQYGNVDKILELYWDNTLIESRQLLLNDVDQKISQSFKLNNIVNDTALIEHGSHSVKFVLSQFLNGKKGYSIAPIEFEVAVVNPSSNMPIIWLGNYQSTYYSYDTIQIPFLIYLPIQTSSARVHLYKENKEIGERIITDFVHFSILEIVDFDINMTNTYTIAYEEDMSNIVQRDIIFEVKPDLARANFGIQKEESLILNFDASGRSNDESVAQRSIWSYTDSNNTEQYASFNNFNWYNNGWITENNKTCLRISNGAEFTIPITPLVFNSSTAGEQSHTFECEFQIRNVQDYSNLIHNITRYVDDTAYFNEFYDTVTNTYKTSYTNYDAFLANWFKTHAEPIYDENNQFIKNKEYDDLNFERVQKQVNINAITGGLYSGAGSAITGFCLGPQDAFFSNGTNTVNVNYIEDTIINLSMVYSAVNKLFYIYINGVLTGVTRNSATDTSFTINNNMIRFNSNYCDIDLYKMRIYNTDLNINEIVTNFAVDKKDVTIYDQNRLAEENTQIKEYQLEFKNMLEYNDAHPYSPIMPYLIFDTTRSGTGDRLVWSKSTPIYVDMEFVNTPLELAYTSGELEELAGPDGDRLWSNNSTDEDKAEAVKKYYKHHCPSFIGKNVRMQVQGTSSEFYPRRNYKIKTKTDTEIPIQQEDGSIKTEIKEVVNIQLNRGPFALDYQLDPEKRESYWYMDNYVAGTTKFTMKIDFMESSGTYNMGFANLVKNAYTKHPLDDLNKNNVLTTATGEYVEATTYKAGQEYFYKNHKGNWKSTAKDELQIASEEDFTLGPVAYAASQGINKVLSDNGSEYYNKWYEATIEYNNYYISNTKSYRTSVQGFRTLTFHKKSDGTYTFIGMYNMLIDKGSDEVFGFKPDKTTGTDVFQKFLKNKKISKIAECWEFENNSRTFCSFRDPMNRKDLSFKVWQVDAQNNYILDNNNQRIPVLNSVRSAPVVVDSYEYRYNANSDLLDYIMNPTTDGEKLNSSDVQEYITKNNAPIEFSGANAWQVNYDNRAKAVFDNYKNWERAVAWVWSTDPDSVLSGGTYSKILNIGNAWKANTFYIQEDNVFNLDTADAYDPTKFYYIKETNSETGEVSYTSAYLGEVPYTPNVFYVKVGNEYVLDRDEIYDPSLEYFTFNTLTDQQLAAGNYDRLVEICNKDTLYEANNIYLYDGEQSPGFATKLALISEQQFEDSKYSIVELINNEFKANTDYYIKIENNYIAVDTNNAPDNSLTYYIKHNPTSAQGDYYKGISITIDGQEYKYDTKEYRAGKFVKELSNHFDIEYLATYFVMTEVFECYDSRGKNAMFASWGPQSENGDYIWYAIFYDIDTQLGINNTGIPSFEYNVDATENNNFSTSDSVLWNNFYKYYKNSAILNKYLQLKGNANSFGTLTDPPLENVRKIEGWYLTNPNICKSIVMRGQRPLIATNLDEYYKYITITNNGTEIQPVSDEGLEHDFGAGYLASDGKYHKDPNGMYFYALQGDRSLSRQQFLANRLEYIDSWLNQGNYRRGGSNLMWGRVAANNDLTTSDLWVATDDPNNSYFLEDGITKRHPLDAEYWVNLTPIKSAYVTLGDDNEAYPSQKYDGINPVKFIISSIEKGVKASKPYPEQLVYIYGMNQMSDVGDLSRLYWQEFRITGAAKHLTRLLLGYDGIVKDKRPGSNEIEDMTWRNGKLNPPSIPAGENASGMPLLKEVNMCNITISEQTPTLDLTTCQKLTNFRATGSNFASIKFAKGVALNTLYLPESITSLELIEARALKTLLQEYHAPELVDNNLVAEPGLWIDNLFGAEARTNLTNLNIIGGGLGFDSYVLMEQIFNIYSHDTQITKKVKINLENIDWSPYKLVEPGDEYDENAHYVQIDNHYGFTTFADKYNVNTWNAQVLGEEIYKFNPDDLNQYPITDKLITILDDFINPTSRYDGINDRQEIPNLTGIVYINNSTPIDEYTIRTVYQPAFPELKLFFAKVTPASTARFIYLEDDGITYHYITKNSNLSYETIEDDGSNWFTNPMTVYHNLDKVLPNYDFYGWARKVANNASGENIYQIGNNKFEVIVNTEDSSNWVRPSSAALELDYTFYAIFKIHSYVRRYYNTVADALNEQVITINGQPLINYQPYTPGRGVELPRDASNNIAIPNLTLEDTEENFYYVNKFIGWASMRAPTHVVDFDTLTIGTDYDFVAIYEKVNVYQNVAPETYFTYSATNGLSLKSEYKNLEGKITLPTTYNGNPVKIISNFNKTKFTHIFWDIHDRALETISYRCFQNCSSLKYYEQPTTCRTINAEAFANCHALTSECIYNILNPVQTVGSGIFLSMNNTNLLLSIAGHTYTNLDTDAFSGLQMLRNIQIGTATDPCDWFTMTNFNSGHVNFQYIGSAYLIDASVAGAGLTSLVIYIDSSHNNDTDKAALLNYLNLVDGQFGNDHSSMATIINDENQNNRPKYCWVVVN